MIKNEKQYKITKGWIRKFEKALQDLEKLPESQEQPWLRSGQKQSILNQLEELYEDVHEYEALKSGKVKVTLPSLEAIAELPTLLIKRRIANGWTLQKLAQKLGMHWQQLQRYEQTDYAIANLQTIQTVAAALSENPRRATMKSQPPSSRRTTRAKA